MSERETHGHSTSEGHEIAFTLNGRPATATVDARLNLADSQDLRRATQAAVQPWGAVLAVATDEHMRLLKPDHFDATGHVRLPVVLRSRLTLPRAAPDDPAAQS